MDDKIIKTARTLASKGVMPIIRVKIASGEAQIAASDTFALFYTSSPISELDAIYYIDAKTGERTKIADENNFVAIDKIIKETEEIAQDAPSITISKDELLTCAKMVKKLKMLNNPLHIKSRPNKKDVLIQYGNGEIKSRMRLKNMAPNGRYFNFTVNTDYLIAALKDCAQLAVIRYIGGRISIGASWIIMPIRH